MKCDLFKKVFSTEKRKWLIKKFLAVCNSHIIIHLLMFFYFLGYGTTITIVSVIGIICGIITATIIIKKDMSLKKLSIYNASIFVIAGIILSSIIRNDINDYLLFSTIICGSISLYFGYKHSDHVYETIVFTLINPVIYFALYMYAISYEIVKDMPVFRFRI